MFLRRKKKLIYLKLVNSNSVTKHKSAVVARARRCCSCCRCCWPPTCCSRAAARTPTKNCSLVSWSRVRATDQHWSSCTPHWSCSVCWLDLIGWLCRLNWLVWIGLMHLSLIVNLHRYTPANEVCKAQYMGHFVGIELCAVGLSTYTLISLYD